MRLTLRTLLAYLDDTLEPSQARLIGEKIAESHTARDLMNRIRDVVRRRRLTAPPMTGPGAKLDPNTIAEYIDSVLPSEKLAEVEETCLESDLYLAEIAACHQILTVVLSEPSKVPPTAKQRMYGLVQGPEAIPYRKAEHQENGAGSIGRAVSERDDTEETLLLGLPSFRSQESWYRKLTPVAVMLLVLVGLSLAIWRALAPATTDRLASDDKLVLNNTASGDVAARTTAVVPEKKPENNSSKAIVPPEKSETKPADSPKAPVPEDPEAKLAKKPVEKQDAKPAEKPDATPGDKPADKPEDKPADKPVPTAIGAGQRKVVGKYVSTATAEANIVLQRQNPKANWQRLIHNNPVYSEDLLVCLPGYRSKIIADSGTVLTLWGNVPDGSGPMFVLECAVKLHASSDAELDVTLDHGRMAITNSKPQGSAKVRVRFYQDSWELVLEPGAEAALELWGTYPPGVDFTKEPTKEDVPQAGLFLFVLKGQLDLKVGDNHHAMREQKDPALKEPVLFFWDNLLGPARGPQPIEKLPSWAGKGARRDPRMTQALEKLSERLRALATPDVVLPEMIKERDPASQVLAVYCLGATDDLPNLLEAMTDDRQPEVRLTCIEVLRHWIGQHPQRDMMLYQELEKKYKSATAEIIMHLLHSYSEERRNKPATYEQLIEWLRSDKLPIRELAFWHLSRLPATAEIAKKIPYDPAGSGDQREQAYDRWKVFVPDGKMPNKNPMPPAPGGKRP